METIDDIECQNPNCDATARTSYNSKTGESHTWCKKCGWDSDNDDETNQEIIDDTDKFKDED
jgi:hypothetical protein